MARGRVVTYLGDDEHKMLLERAESEGRSVANLLRQLVRTYLEVEPDAPPAKATPGSNTRRSIDAYDPLRL